MLDELCLRAVDWTVETFSRWFAPWKVRLKRSFLGFRPALIASSMKRTAGQLFSKIATAAGGDGFLQRLILEPVEPVNAVSFKEAFALMLARADAFFAGRMFPYQLLLTMLSVCLLAASGARELSVLAAFFCLHWLAAAMDEGYEPVCAGIRQRYLAAQLLRAGAYLTLLLDYFFSYAQNGLEINVILQGAMALTMIIHAALYLSFVAFNRRQQLFLRLMSGVLGFAPALACAAGVALGASTAARELTVALGGAVRAVGVLLAFLSQQVNMIDQLGGGRLRFGRLWQGLTMTIGFFMMLFGAWLCAL